MAATFQSVFAQTFDDFEYIVIDGGSTDGSVALIEDHASKIDYWVSERDRGIYHAMNKGIAVARGTYLLFLNGGDELLDEGVLAQAFYEVAPEHPDLVYFNIKYEMEYGRCRVDTFPKQLTLKYIITEYLPHQATLIKRTLFDPSNVGLYDETHAIASDWKFFALALFKYHASYQYIPLTLSFFRFGGISTTMDGALKEEVQRWRDEVLVQHFPDDFRKAKRQLELERLLKKYSGYFIVFKGLKRLRYFFFKWVGV